jgi:hypothetical protein
MPKTLKIADGLHAELVRRAERRHQTVDEYVESLLSLDATPPDATDLDEVLERIRQRGFVKLKRPVAEYLREAHEERDEQIASSLRHIDRS